jgi:ribonuclease E
LSPFALPGADQPLLQPVYAGPTPADPFGGRAFDIFDVMDQVERAAEAKPAPRAGFTAEIVNNTAPEPETSNVESEPVAAVSEVRPESALEPDVQESSPPEADIRNTAAPEPVGESLRGRTGREAATPPTPANDTSAEIVTSEPPAPESLIRPILIGAGGEAPAEPKRGWWRR